MKSLSEYGEEGDEKQGRSIDSWWAAQDAKDAKSKKQKRGKEMRAKSKVPDYLNPDFAGEPETAEDVISKTVDDASKPLDFQDILDGHTPEDSFAKFLSEQESEPVDDTDELMKSVFKDEGGYSTDEKDTGNYYEDEFVGTNHGISAPVLAEHLGRTPTVEDMKNLTQDEARDMYKADYYDKFGIESLPKDLQEIVLHSVVNSGSNGAKVVQDLLGVKSDGIVGKQTKAAMKDAKFTKQEFKDALMDKYKTFKTWDDHGKGWDKRFQKLADK